MWIGKIYPPPPPYLGYIIFITYCCIFGVFVMVLLIFYCSVMVLLIFLTFYIYASSASILY